MRSWNTYVWLGVGLCFTGVWVAPVAHFLLESTPITALGMSMLILGAVCLVLGRTRPRISPEASSLLLETSVENVSSILEELGLTSRGIYVPSSKAQGVSQALVPLQPNPPSAIARRLPKRLIVKYGPRPEDMGLLITTPGSVAVRMLESIPGPTAAELEDSLSSVLDGLLDVADAARVSMNGQAVTVRVSHPRLEYSNVRYYQCLGGPVASIAAALAAEATGRPVVVEKEEYSRGNSIIQLRLLDEGL